MTNILLSSIATSLKSGNPVFSELLKVLPNTVMLTVFSMLIASGLSIPIGVLCAHYQDGVLDRIVRLITYGFASMPSFFLSLVMMYLFCVKLHLFPVISTASGKGIVLPALVLGLTNAAWFTRQVRAIVVREQNNDYVLGLRSRGVGELSIMFRHVLKNSLLPVLTLVGVSFGSLLGGATIVESIFSWPGLGKQALLTGVAEGLRYHTGLSRSEREVAAKEMLESMGLPGSYASKKCRQLSGGECQRAALARAMLIHPELLICDEVTSALDVSVQAQIIRLLYDVRKKEKMSCLFISHDLALVSGFCDRILVMYQGKIVESGPAREIICQPRHEYTKKLISSVYLV